MCSIINLPGSAYDIEGNPMPLDAQFQSFVWSLQARGYEPEFSNDNGEFLLEWIHEDNIYKVFGWATSGEAYSTTPAIASRSSEEFLTLMKEVIAHMENNVSTGLEHPE